MSDLLRQLAHLLGQAIDAERASGRLRGLQEALNICDHLANMGNWDQTVGAAESARRIREKLEGR